MSAITQCRYIKHESAHLISVHAGVTIKAGEMTTLKTGLVFRTRWKLGKKLGEGACAQVFEVEDINSGAQKSIKWVMKLAPLPASGELVCLDILFFF